MNKRIISMMVSLFIIMCCSFTSYAASIDVVKDLKWEGTIATWSASDDAYRYEVTLYKNGTKQNTYTSDKNRLDMASYMRKKGTYTFSVKVLDRVQDEYGKASAKSPGYTIEKDIDPTYTSYGTGSSTGIRSAAGAGKSSSSNNSNNNTPVDKMHTGPGGVNKGWRQDSTGWWFLEEDGSYPVSTWKTIDGENYYFDASGYMKTGWITIGTNSYYADSTGKLLKGWCEIGGSLYHFSDDGVYIPGR